MTLDTVSVRSASRTASELVRSARRRSGLSQRSLARRSGTSQAAISRIEGGLEQPTLERLEQILAGLGWRLRAELEPIADHDAEPRRLYELEHRDPGERLGDGYAWMELANELRRGAKRGPAS